MPDRHMKGGMNIRSAALYARTKVPLLERRTVSSAMPLLARLGVAFAALVFAGCAAVSGAQTGRFEIGLIGDQHYDAESSAQFPNIMADMNRENLAFVVHVGDIGSPVYNSCQDETYLQRREEFNRSRHPLVFTPGDNEWTDCHQAGIPDSIERLAKVREVFFQDETSLGRRTLPVTRQSTDPRYVKFRENARWIFGDVVFVTLNIPGSNNNRGRTPEMDAEYLERNAADIEWMRQAFEYAKQHRNKAIMILIQANPRFEDHWPASRRTGFGIAPRLKGYNGYDEFLLALKREVLAYNRPVALVHGDTHYFRVDSPLIVDDKSGAGRGWIVENFTRVELYGYPSAHWVRATVDSADPNVFRFSPGIVTENSKVRLGN
jgi:hypothetical protein